MMAHGPRTASALLAAGLLATAAAGCSGQAKPGRAAASAPASSPADYATASYVNNAIQLTLDKVTGMHVDGTYTLGQEKAVVDMDLLTAGSYAGRLTLNGVPGSLLDAGGHLYTPIIAAMLPGTALAGQCAQVCGKYVPEPAGSVAASTMTSVGPASTLKVLNAMTDGITEATTTVSVVTYQGRQAIRLDIPFYGPGAYLIVTDSAACVPLAAVAPGHFSLAFSQWNAVPAPAVPTAAQIIPASRLA